MAFPCPPVLILGEDGRTFVLARPAVYCGCRDTFTIPAGTRTDFASVPRFLHGMIPPSGTVVPAAIVHDYLCAEAQAGRFSRRDADGVFARICRESGLSPLHRHALYLGVRVGGARCSEETVTRALWLCAQALVFALALLIPGIVALAATAAFGTLSYLSRQLEEPRG